MCFRYVELGNTEITKFQWLHTYQSQLRSVALQTTHFYTMTQVSSWHTPCHYTIWTCKLLSMLLRWRKIYCIVVFKHFNLKLTYDICLDLGTLFGLTAKGPGNIGERMWRFGKQLISLLQYIYNILMKTISKPFGCKIWSTFTYIVYY